MSADTKPTSSYYAAKFRELKENDMPFIKPETIPLDYGRRFLPFPCAFEPYPFEMAVEWIWLNFAFNRNFWLTVFATIYTLLAIALVVAARVKFNITKTVLAGIFTLASFMLILLRINAAQNENHRRALCYLYEKKEQAIKVWSQFGESEKIYCKDVFYETSSFQGKFRVLRDGTVEVIPYTTYEGKVSPLQAFVEFNEQDDIESGRGPGSSHV